MLEKQRFVETNLYFLTSYQIVSYILVTTSSNRPLTAIVLLYMQFRILFFKDYKPQYSQFAHDLLNSSHQNSSK